MIGFEYGNARLRAMKARLLSREEMEGMAGAGNLQSLINVLSETPYRQALEAALIRTHGREAILQALHDDLVNKLSKIKSFFSDRTLEWVMLALRSYDIHNLKTILRGRDSGAPADEIRQYLLPVGQLSPAILDELAHAASPREVINRMASMGLPFAQPLLELRGERPGAEVFEMEVALEQWHDRDLRRRLERAPKEASYLLEAQDMEADIQNILTALRFAQEPGARKWLRGIIDSDEMSGLLIGPGELSFKQLESASEQESVAEAVEALSRPPYEEALRDGYKRFESTGQLSEIERKLELFRLRWRERLVIKDPLGIGVLLSYLGLKINEVKNIRRITLETEMEIEPYEILKSLEFAR